MGISIRKKEIVNEFKNKRKRVENCRKRVQRKSRYRVVGVLDPKCEMSRPELPLARAQVRLPAQSVLLVWISWCARCRFPCFWRKHFQNTLRSPCPKRKNVIRSSAAHAVHAFWVWSGFGVHHSVRIPFAVLWVCVRRQSAVLWV